MSGNTAVSTAARDARVLAPAQVQSFARDGVVVVPGFFDRATMHELSGWTDELLGRPEVPGRHWVYYEDDTRRDGARVLSRIENFCPFHPAMNALLTGERVMRALAQLFGEPALLFKDKINFKLPGSAGFEPHQDVQAGWDRYADLHISMLVSIDAATPRNGCLEIAAGWHDRGLIGDMWTPLGDTVPDAAYRCCPTAVGDVVFFDSFVPHRSAPNATDAPRRVLYMTYNRLSAGDQRARYYADKHASYPPDIERAADREYVYRV
jgi:hypothetical protein